MKSVGKFLSKSFVAVWVTFSAPFAVMAQPPSPPSTAPSTTKNETLESTTSSERSLTAAPSLVSELEEKRRAVNRQLESLPEAETKKVELLQSVELTLSQRISALQERERLIRFSPSIPPLPSGAEPSYSFLEELRDRLRQIREKRGTLNATKEGAERAFEEAKSKLDGIERERRRIKEQSSLATLPDERNELERLVGILELQLQLANESVPLKEIELENERLKLKNGEREENFLAKKVEQLSQRVVLTAVEHQQHLDKLARIEADLNQSLDTVILDIRSSEKLLTDAKLRFESAEEPSERLLEEVQARLSAKQLREREATLLRGALERIKLRREVWNHRLALASREVSRTDSSQWRKNLSAEKERFQKILRDESARVQELQKQQDLLSLREGESSNRWIREQRQSLNRAVVAYQRNLDDLTDTLLLLERFLDELNKRDRSFSIVLDTAHSFWSGILGVWELELTSVDDRPITVRKIVLAFIFFLVGVVVSRRVSRYAGRRVLSRFDLKPGASAAIESFTFYLLVLTFAFVALRVVHIPLTVFTLLGGALAIGVGFGSQNVISNFISGLIILIEQPVRVGDLIEVDQLKGTVIHIGMRSTTVRTGRNTDIIVPNTFFLEKNVVNWTLNDDRVRINIVVGVMYGSPLDDVKRLLLQAAEEHPHTLKDPPPFVWLTSFGDSAVVFELHAWVSLKTFVDRGLIESDLRFRVHELFAEAEIIIPYPRRDITLHTDSPLSVRVEDEKRGIKNLNQS